MRRALQSNLVCVGLHVADEDAGLRAAGMHFSLRNGGQEMKKQKTTSILVLALLGIVPAAWTQTDAQPKQTGQQTLASTNSNAQNVQAYTELLRSNVRQQKAEVMGATMELSAADAAKFWPIYEEYDANLKKLNDQRIANIKEYANSYNNMTDKTADELVQNALEYRKQRMDLLAKCYEQVKQALGAVTAARFIQVEDQLLLIIDLQIDSYLPVIGQAE